ncbi:MAG: cytochrome-c oxidase, cbb3-type subunit III [Gammaproteobacteria bacterium]|nr:cytochrome-c oxidase, cbb3-type subunit III [Gammaproteobacteria bacterium]MBU1624741.1 cytochrome-c oxidase, cbb3-type subunit III [Gammaproteobacteria bacterium]MBU1982585.1 cytochrome-c oxidase, cbb3-type subunit III [Gammaproteobacteria bacterium]
MSDKHDASSVPTTGHVWDDDLGDYINQPPKWWMLGLTVSAIWCVVYWLYYPAFPISNAGYFTKGLGGWTAIGEMEADKSVVDEVRGKYEAKLKDMTPAAILADSELTEYVTRSGKVLFGDNCAACHGTNGVGTHDKQGLFAPILNDDDWLYGGTIDTIHETIQGGRQGMMMAHADMLSEAEIDTLANAVAAGKPTSTPLFAEKGCTACHGEDGKGMQAMGSANLTDSVWRFDGSVEGIKYTIKNGVNSGMPDARVAVMPAFQGGKLSDAEIKKLAVYVYKFGGGQAQ